MRISALTSIVISLASIAIASPVDTNEKSSLTERGNGSEIVYLVTCNGQPHASKAVYYSNWQDSQTYGAHWPNSISGTNSGFTSATNLIAYSFQDTLLAVNVYTYDPGWYQVAGRADNSLGTNFICRMDNGRQLYADCFSNYYCQ
ncbi:hypothetical protein CPB83DRAFT_886790 [Crepidotus variabilis]|uniref:Uncharacterized protein n=1 Tax=Crepidotus variabilis TaxID=179855 RepID=A0A9P6JK56_9AGAR|nr:hypothetical protein CPB83DRAFT_886790 [Crepidotus variabilis]